MRVFITGASGWVGSAAVEELLRSGHEVLGLARSDAAAERLTAVGAAVLRGDLDDPDSLRRGADGADAVVHLANKHDWADMPATNAAERAAVRALGDALAGSGRPLVIAAGVAGVVQGRPAEETDPSPAHGPDSPRGGSENLALEYVERDVRVMALRLAPSTHGHGDHGFVSLLAGAAVRQGVSAYIGDGAHAWSAVHRADAARLIRLGLEHAPAGAWLHAVAEQAVPTRAIAEALGASLGLPVTSIPAERAAEHFGFIGAFFGMDLRATSEATRKLVDWQPTGPTLLEDIASGGYPGR
ncbi:SDR family oxidoreductase [Nocardia higoensis]|uniref:SDR family oxidoreductase n=1 Tax=Nocardia higoensis TaxID=228599 RepID=UPI0003010A1F|nr:SDR family oxidoreductase [Nocardia higoensis]